VAARPLSTPLSQLLVAFTIELDNEFERRLAETGLGRRTGISLVMWSNFLRFVGDGIAVADLPAAAGTPKARTLSTVGGMERWGFVTVGPAGRDGFGSSRGLRGDWIVRLTPAGEQAQEIWQRLPGEIEGRWEERFGAAAVAELRKSLGRISSRLDVTFPDYVPIVAGSDGFVAGLGPSEPKGHPSSHLPALLSRVLLAYTLDFERACELSLPLTENVVRVVGEEGVHVRDLPLAAAVSKEAVAVALNALEKSGHVTVADKLVRLTPEGRAVQERAPAVHAAVEAGWEARFGAADVRRLRAAIESLVADPRLSEGLRPHPGGWRGTPRYQAHTEAMLADPQRGLPRYPMVLHRGGWPDGC
jgi:DNA-binding MarR family transcriptional regulator